MQPPAIEMISNTPEALSYKEYLSSLPPPPPLAARPDAFVPDDEQCFAYWRQYDMLENVAEHSLVVAQVATWLAERGREVGLNVDIPTARASALLHDIAKSYCIRHGGSHSQLGGAWVTALTGNPLVAAGVTHHVYWPYEMDIEKYFTPFTVIYADKRVRHDNVVTIRSRFDDLVNRYGITDYYRSRIQMTMDQALDLEACMSERLKVDLNEYTFDSGRLV